MKKLLISILGILGIGLSFCSADWVGSTVSFTDSPTISRGGNAINIPGNCVVPLSNNSDVYVVNSIDSTNTSYPFTSNKVFCDPSQSSTGSILYLYTTLRYAYPGFAISQVDFGGGSTSSCPDQLIDVQYNSGNSTTITCDGINYISIDGLSTLTNSNVNYEYTPFFNIDYKDEDNQSLVESYDKSILYLSGSLFKKTYTNNNDWILSSQGSQTDNSFSGYLPTFDITGGIEEISTSGNIFNNFAENSVKFTLSNVPSYIQYVIIIMLLLFVLGFIRKFKRR